MSEIHHIVSRIDKKASGLSSAIPQICHSLFKEKLSPVLHVTHEIPIKQPYRINTYPHWKIFDNISISPNMHNSLKTLKGEDIIIHNHSLWTMPNLYPGFIASKNNIDMIFSPHGTLSSWALNHSKWKKKIFWALGQNLALKNATCFHGTAESEYEDIRNLGFKQPVAIIPLGIDLPAVASPKTIQSSSPFTLLFMARLHPKKGLDLLLDVWQKIQDQFPSWQLHIAGPEDYPGYNQFLNKTINNRSCKRVKLLGPIYGDEKNAALSNASLYILPTHSENFGITIAEALAAGTPVITTKGTPWQDLQKHECGWWIDRNEAVLMQTLMQAMSLSVKQRHLMGKSGKKWIENEFSWKKAAQNLKITYQWMKGKESLPEWIIQD